MPNDGGFNHIYVLLIVLVLGVVGLAWWKVLDQRSTNETTFSVSNTEPNKTEKVSWSQTENGWKASGTPPTCPESLVRLPVDISLVTSILYPGQRRTGGYKPHGGFRFDKVSSNNVSITAPFDAEVVRGARYSVNGDPQFTFDFIHPCGYMYRLGHLLTLSPKLSEIAAKLPVNGEGDSHDMAINSREEFKAGELIATATGITRNGSGPSEINVFVDWGVYDLRTKNQASRDVAWAAQHPSETEQHALCWFDLLSAEDEAKVRALPSSDGQSGKNSDFCM